MFFEVYIMVYLWYIWYNICYWHYLDVSRTCVLTRLVHYQVWDDWTGVLSGFQIVGQQVLGQRSPLVWALAASRWALAVGLWWMLGDGDGGQYAISELGLEKKIIILYKDMD